MITKLKLLSLIILFSPLLLLAQVNYSSYFKDNTLRVDYLLGGTKDSAEIVLKQLKSEPNYGGSHHCFIDTMGFGTYRYRLFDQKKGTLIFSKGFCPIFKEWQTTDDAKVKKGSFYQVAILPFPKNKVLFVVEERNWKGDFIEVFSTIIDPESYYIIDEKLPDYDVKVIADRGNPQHKVDLVFLPEGYTNNEMDKFIDDVKRMTDALFAAKPFDKYKANFNLYAIKVPSLESGTDVPGEHIFKNTAFNSSFFTFGTPRYLTSDDLLAIHNAAALVPYDHIYLLVNTDRYGGGGFYNYISITSVDDKLSEKVFIHEFGHGLAGLADEYYSSDVAYNNYYNLQAEPWEANITTLHDFESKWANLLEDTTPIPTPRNSKYKKTIGVFEGGGYLNKGIYSPMMDCRMKSNVAKDFCPACVQTISKVINWHCQ